MNGQNQQFNVSDIETGGSVRGLSTMKKKTNAGKLFMYTFNSDVKRQKMYKKTKQKKACCSCSLLSQKLLNKI